MTTRLLGLLAVAVATLLFHQSAFAQQARIRGQITSVNGSVISVRTREGDDVTIHLADKVGVSVVVKASLDDIKPTSYVGAAAMPQPDGSLKALEVHIFPANLRGTGEGLHDFDLEPGSSMINATVSGTVASAAGPTLTLTYPNGTKTVVIPQGTPIVTMVPGTVVDVKAGVGTIIFGGDKEADGSIDAARIMVGRDGVNPPM